MCSISHDYELTLIKTYSEGGLRRFRLCSLKWNTLLETLICRGRIGYIHYYGSFIFFKSGRLAFKSQIHRRETVCVPPKEANDNCHTETMSEAFELFEDQICANANGRPSCGQNKNTFPLCIPIWQMKIYQNSSSPVVIKVIYECM